MSKIIRFFIYNNIVPITISFVLLGAASTYAATNPEQILAETQKVVSIDNTYIANKDLSRYTPKARIVAVREDSDFYYVSYQFTTIELVEYVWQDVTMAEEMKIAKATLGTYRDLGEFVTRQLRERIANELIRLRETQVFERQNITQKQVTTQYSGLIGGLLDDKTETIAGYTPVVEAPSPETERQTFARPDPNAKMPAQPIPAEELRDDETTYDDDEEDYFNQNNPPSLTVLGDNPARVPLGGTYTDLGVVVDDDHDGELTAYIFLDGAPVSAVQIDTSKVATYTIIYEATDSKGKIGQVKRMVEVYDPNAVTEPVGETTDPTPAAPVETPVDSSTPPPVPENQEPSPSTNAPEDNPIEEQPVAAP